MDTKQACVPQSAIQISTAVNEDPDLALVA